MVVITRLFKYIYKYAKHFIGYFVIAEICIAILYCISIILPWNLSRLIDNVIYQEKYSLLDNVVVTYIVLFLISTFINLLYAFVWQTLNNKYVVKIKNDMYTCLLKADSKYLSDINSGDAISRIEWESEQFIHVIQKNVFHFLNSLVLCVVVLVLIFNKNTILGVITLLSVILPVIAIKPLNKKTEKVTAENKNSYGVFVGKVFEIFSGFREVKLFNSQLWAENQIINNVEKTVHTSNKQKTISVFVQNIAAGISTLCQIVLFCYSAFLVINSELTIGVFLAIMQYVSLLNYKFDWILTLYNDWHWRKVSINRCCEILDSVQEQTGLLKIDKIDTIEFENVTFGYGEEVVLNNISFLIKKGEKIGVVGASGVGKTTIISLLTKLYTPQKGKILVNNIDIQDIDTKNLRDKLGIVSQDVRLFNSSIRFNLTMGDNYSDMELIEMLSKTNMKEKIMSLPDGLDTVYEWNNVGLSGGQIQRIMIARALIKESEMIICDEATSALDVDNEEEISKVLYELLTDKIGIFISHRYKSIVGCDRILVLKNGEIDAIGTNEDLKNRCDEYMLLFGGELNAQV